GGKFNSPNGEALLKQIRNSEKHQQLPFIFLIKEINNEVRKSLLKSKVNEIFEYNFKKEDFFLRVNYLINRSQVVKEDFKRALGKEEYEMPVIKRAFDIVFASIALLLLSPFLLLIAILIRLESKGPIFYAAKRAGTGYQIFDFYKFRSMKVGADAMLKDIAHLNQYKKSNPSAPIYEDGGKPGVVPEEVRKNPEKTQYGQVSAYIQEQMDAIKNNQPALAGLCTECREQGKDCQSVLMLDDKLVCEKSHLKEKKEKAVGETFIKIKNDPRVTRIGKFIRNTSIDELPQLVNVLKGDMSIVGNRPLPLYEAEKITIDQFTLRFMAPAGITGLWQVTKRGTSEMSEEERMQLDNDYARDYSFWRDIKIILKTIPALLQKESV
ncbi:MAG: sugar transferase, partial [Cytophagaceae bacterium]